MHARGFVALYFAVAVLSAPAAVGAGSGDLWFSFTCPESTPARILLDSASPVTITISAVASAPMAHHTLDLSLMDLAGVTVFSQHLYIASGTSTTITTPSLAAGTYFFKPVGGTHYDLFRFATSASHFVWPSCTDFYADATRGISPTGTYYFYVPPGTSSFQFRLYTPDDGAGRAKIFAPDGSERWLLTVFNGEIQTLTIPVDIQSAGGFWRVELTSHISDLQLYLYGIPDFFAESPSAWFEPPEAGAKPKTFLNLTHSPQWPGVGDDVTLSAAVVPAGATGTVTFVIDGQPAGSAPLIGGHASVVTTFSTSGLHEVVAQYSGDGTWAASAGSDSIGWINSPTLTAIDEDMGPTAGGTPVKFSGTGFQPGCTVSFDGQAGTSVVVWNTTSISAVTPSHAAGKVPVSVTCPSGTASLADAFEFIAPPSGAGSGDLWFNNTSPRSNPAMLRLDNAGPVTIYVSSIGVGGTALQNLDLSLIDLAGATVFSRHLDIPSGAGTEAVRTPSLPAGTYRLKAVGNYTNFLRYVVFRFATSASHFVWPSGNEFIGNPGQGVSDSGTYYFFVPRGTTSFQFRKYRFRYSDSVARIFAPDGSQRALLSFGPDTVTIAVDAASSAAFWRVDLSGAGNSLLLSTSGVPGFFAESPAAWFEPPTAPGLKLKTYLNVTYSPEWPGTGDNVTLSTAVVPAAATGTVAFKVDGQPVGSAPLTGGVASIVTTFSTSGLHEVVAQYSGDETWASSTESMTVGVTGPPTLTSIDPRTGTTAGGTRVAVTGTGFGPSCTMAFDGLAGTSLRVANTTAISAVAPAHAPGTVAVSVTCPLGTATLDDALEYVEPAVGADSGELWCAASAGPRVIVPREEPLKVTIIARTAGGGGTLDLSLKDLSGVSIYSQHFTLPEGETTLVVTTPSVAAGVYFLQAIGSTNAVFRFITSATHLVLQLVSCTDLRDPGEGNTDSGTYFFYVPRGTTKLLIEGGNWPFAPDGTVRYPDRNYWVQVDPAFTGKFWWFVLQNRNSATSVWLSSGAPNFLAESIDTWFEPPASPGKAKTYLSVGMSPWAPSPGGNVTFTASIVPAAATGTVAFTFDGQPAGISPVVGGAAAFTTAFAAGPHTIAAQYSGDQIWAASQTTWVVPAEPAVASVDPPGAPTEGGTRVTVHGTNFTGDCKVSFGGVPATFISAPNASSLTVTTPAHAAGVVPVTVSCPAGDASIEGAFTYVAPAAGSGELYLRHMCPGGSAKMLVPESGPLTIKMIHYCYENFPVPFDLSVQNVSGLPVYSARMSVDYASTQTTVTTPTLSPGTYSLNAAGSWFVTSRFVTSASHFVWPSCSVFSDRDFVGHDTGDFYFYVPSWTTSFRFIAEVENPPDVAWDFATVTVFGPDDTARGSRTLTGPGAQIITLAVDPASAGAFWRVHVNDLLYDLKLELEGVPPFFAESPDRWFEPNAAGVKPRTFLKLISDPPSPEAGTTVTLTANVVPSAASGTVTFKVDGNTVGVVPLVSGSASTTTTFSTGGTHQVIAEYSGDQTWAASSGTIAQGVGGEPSLADIDPHTGPPAGSTTVTLTGINFVQGCSVTFGGVPATSVTVTDSARMVATTPAHAEGTVDVSVVCPAGTASLSNAFRFAQTPSQSGSGSLWFRYTCADSTPARLFLDHAGPIQIDVVSNTIGHSASLDLSLIDPAGSTVYSQHLQMPPSTPRHLETPTLPAGTYIFKPVGSAYAFSRFKTSAAHFVWPSCTDFMGDTSEGLDAVGEYYFYVPVGTNSFKFRLQVPDSGEKGSAWIFAPDSTLRGSLELTGSADESLTINVDTPSDAGFWRVHLTNNFADIRFFVEGVPPWFAESPDAWFEPSSAQSAQLKTYIEVSVQPEPGATTRSPSATAVQHYRLIASVVPVSATGMVTFIVDGQPVGSAPLVGGEASILVTFATGGVHAIRAEYAGDGLLAASNVTVSVEIAPAQAVSSIPLGPSAILLLAFSLAIAAVWTLRS